MCSMSEFRGCIALGAVFKEEQDNLACHCDDHRGRSPGLLQDKSGSMLGILFSFLGVWDSLIFRKKRILFSS